MRERITVEEASTDSSSGQPSRSWSALLSDEPAAFQAVTGGETLRGRQVEANVRAVFTVHYNASIVREMRVVHGSDTYGIVNVHRVEGGQRYLELDCKQSGLA